MCQRMSTVGSDPGRPRASHGLRCRPYTLSRFKYPLSKIDGAAEKRPMSLARAGPVEFVGLPQGLGQHLGGLALKRVRMGTATLRGMAFVLIIHSRTQDSTGSAHPPAPDSGALEWERGDPRKRRKSAPPAYSHMAR